MTGRLFAATAALFLCFGAFAAEIAEFELKIDPAQLRLTDFCKVTARDGGQFLTVTVPKDSKEIRQQNCAFLEIDLKPFVGKGFQASVMMRGKDVSQPPQPYNGVKFMLHYRNREGNDFWKGSENPKGSFDWRESTLFTDIPTGATTGTLRMGLQDSSGEVEFDLSTLRVTTTREKKEEVLPLTPELARELDLIESRMRGGLLAAKPMPEEDARALTASQKPDGTFAYVDYEDDNRSVWKTARHLADARRLALVWASPGHPLYHDRATGEAVRKAVAWWSEKRPQSSNWWWNDMSVPQTMSDILLLAPELFPDGPERTAALQVCRQAKLLPRYTGNNRVFAAANLFRRALLERNVAPLTEAAAALSEEIRFAPAENKTAWAFGGIRADGCYHQHGPQIQFGNYGGEFFSNIGYWSNIWKETRWELSPEQWRIMHHLAFNGFQWVLWRGKMDLLACGRQLGRDAAAKKGERTMAAFERLSQADPGPRAYYLAVEDDNFGVNMLTGNRHFWNSDYMVHRRPEWYAAVRMNSERVRPIEDDTNFDNALGRYFSDGVLLVMRSGKEYENITACWDWTRLPGGTLPRTPVYTPEESRKNGLTVAGKPLRWTHSKKFRRIGETEFVGGVSDTIRGVAVFTMDVDGVKARKGYFFDADAIYGLGNGVSSESPFPVATTVNSCRRNGEIKQGENWVWHDGIGYRGEGMKLETGVRKGDWRYLEGGLVEPTPAEADLFTLTVDHGLKPENAAYAFTILPGATAEATAAGSKGKVIAATEKLQAVEFADGAIGAIFYEPGTLGDFSTSDPGVFLIAKDRVYAADPTAKLRTLTVRRNGTERVLTLPGGEDAGSTVTEIF